SGGRGVQGRIFMEYANKAVAALGNGLNILRMLGIVFEHRTNLPNCKVEAVLEIDMDFGSPDLFNYLLPGDDFAGAACKSRQHFRRLRLKLDGRSITAQFSTATVQLKFAEEDALSRVNLARQIGHSNAKS